MRLVTILAGHAARVLSRDHLGKALRFRGVLLMAAPAKGGHFGQFRNVGSRVVGVLRQWAVARFAGDVCVFSRCPGFALILVAKHTGVLPGVGNGPLSNHRQSARPVVAILAEIFWNDRATNGEEDPQPRQEDHSWPDQVAGISEEASQKNPLFPHKLVEISEIISKDLMIVNPTSLLST